jgi:NADPH-dependent curcumin reductase CurA
VLCKAAACWPVPAATAAAAACTISGVTAAASLRGTARLQAGETVLVTAAAGGTGHFAVQLAAAAGCHVVATCGGARKAALVRSLGAHRVIDHTAEDVAAVLAAEYPRGIDVVYEGVGGAMLCTAMNALAEGGRCLVIGYISGYPVRRARRNPMHARGWRVA